MRALSAIELEQVSGGYWNDDPQPEDPNQPPLPEPDTESPFRDLGDLIDHIMDNPFGTIGRIVEAVDGQETELQQEAEENGHPCPTCHPPMP